MSEVLTDRPQVSIFLETLLIVENNRGGGYLVPIGLSLKKSEIGYLLRKTAIFDPKRDWKPKCPPELFCPVNKVSKNV